MSDQKRTVKKQKIPWKPKNLDKLFESYQKRNNKRQQKTISLSYAIFVAAAKLGLTMVILCISFWWLLETTFEAKKAKRAYLNDMSREEVARYIMEKNPGTLHIDAITEVHPISFHDNVLEFPYYVRDGFLRRLSSGFQSNESVKNRLQSDTLSEDCRKTAFSVFLKKGGVMHYTYHLYNDDESEFLFDFNNTWETCLE